MRYYIATKLARHTAHNEVRDELDRDGWACTYDWTRHGSVKDQGKARIRQVAAAETRGVLEADVVIVLLPGGRGTHAELGMALAAGKPVILHSETGEEFEDGASTCAFYWHPLCRRVVCGVEFLGTRITADGIVSGEAA